LPRATTIRRRTRRQRSRQRRRLALALGADKLFNVYPSEVPVASRYLGVFRFDTQSAQIGLNDSYYYVRASYRF
jgi:iron complex outermembrane receptor protein